MRVRQMCRSVMLLAFEEDVVDVGGFGVEWLGWGGFCTWVTLGGSWLVVLVECGRGCGLCGW